MKISRCQLRCLKGKRKTWYTNPNLWMLIAVILGLSRQDGTIRAVAGR